MSPLPAPVLALCGWSGSGKTTLLEAVLPRLAARGWSVAVLKHDAHGLMLDHPGKDSDRLFRAGADVLLGGPGESATRTHRAPGAGASAGDVLRLARAALRDHDLLLVEGHKDTPLPKVWLAAENDPAPPAGIDGVLAVLPRDAARPAAFEAFVTAWLPRAWCAVPVAGGVLFGGRSTRMGAPKQLALLGGTPLAARVHAALAARLDPVALLGSGPLPDALADAPRVADPPGAAGPLAALAGALRWADGRALLAAACDQPRFAPAAVDWLLAQRAPGAWAIVPRAADGTLEPLGALYEPQALGLCETLLAAGRAAPRHLEGHAKVLHPAIPAELAPCWRGANTGEELRALEDDR